MKPPSFDEFKNSWALLAQLGVWLTSLVVVFVTEPPRLWPDADPPALLRFNQFVIAVLTGCVFVLFYQRSRRPDMRLWLRVTLASLAAGVLLFATYTYLTSYWTAEYDNKGMVVIGSRFTDLEQKWLAQHPEIDPGDATTLVRDHAGQTDEIWYRDELINRYLKISACYSLLVVTMSLSVLFVIQALRCSASEPA